jgi:hypothetical protein
MNELNFNAVSRKLDVLAEIYKIVVQHYNDELEIGRQVKTLLQKVKQEKAA